MLGKLKDMAGKAAGNGILDKAVKKICPQLQPQMDKLKDFNGNELRCDDTFTSKFVNPTLTILAAATSGVTKLIPGFEQRFTTAMLHTRDELCLICPETNKVTLSSDLPQRLPQVLLEGFQKAA
jgi:hypothetical protein